jgi:chromate transporter
LFTTFAGYVAGGIPGAVVATFFVFLSSFVFVLGGAHYIEKVRENRGLQAFLAGVSAAVVGVIAVVSLDLIPQALVDWPSVGISLAAFFLIAFLKRDVALVALGAMVGGIVYASVRAFAL